MARTLWRTRSTSSGDVYVAFVARFAADGPIDEVLESQPGALVDKSAARANRSDEASSDELRVGYESECERMHAVQKPLSPQADGVPEARHASHLSDKSGSACPWNMQAVGATVSTAAVTAGPDSVSREDTWRHAPIRGPVGVIRLSMTELNYLDTSTHTHTIRRVQLVRESGRALKLSASDHCTGAPHYRYRMAGPVPAPHFAAGVKRRKAESRGPTAGAVNTPVAGSRSACAQMSRTANE